MDNPSDMVPDDDTVMDYRTHSFGRTFRVTELPNQLAYKVHIAILWLKPICENGVPGDHSCYGKPEVVRREEYLIPYDDMVGPKTTDNALRMARNRADELLRETQLFIELGD